MGDELASNQEVVGRPVAEGISHMSVPPGNAATVGDELQQPVLLRLGHVAEFLLVTRPCGGPDRRDQVDIGKVLRAFQRFHRIVDGNAETIVAKQGLIPVAEMGWCVAFPATDKQNCLHFRPLFTKERMEAMSRSSYPADPAAFRTA